MILAKVLGNIVATQKNERYESARVMLCQQITPEGDETGSTVLALDAVDAGVLKLLRRRHRPVTTDDNEPVDAQGFQYFTRVRDHFLGDLGAFTGADLGHEVATIGGADDRASTRHDPRGIAAA